MDHYLKYLKINFILLSAFYFFSCQESNQFEPILTPYNQLPIVSGIVITDATGNELNWSPTGYEHFSET